MSKLRVIVPAALSVLFCACSYGRVHEVYHFPGTRDGEVQNYYRVEVCGKVTGTEVRYLSGFFDEDALNRYFNTFSQPEGGAILPADAPAVDADPVTAESRDADPQGKGRKLVLFLSQNSDAIAEQIGGLAQSEEFARVVGALVFKEELAALESLRVDVRRQDDFVDTTREDATQTAERLGAGSPEEQADSRRALLRLINQTAARLGRAEPFATFEAAEAWLNSNRSQLIQGES